MAMPGAFHSSAGAYVNMQEHDGEVAPLFQQQRRPSTRSSLFIPPSPSPTPTPTPTPAQSTSFYSTSGTIVRKRPRLDTSTRQSHGPQPFVGDADEAPPSPVPLVNTDYRIAGGLDLDLDLDSVRAEHGPNTGTDGANEWDLEREDLRVNRFAQPASQSTSPSAFPHTPSQQQQQQQQQNDGKSSGVPTGWGRTLWTLTGGVAGRLISFCWTTAFHGFHAGGGQGYDMQLDASAGERSWPDVSVSGGGYDGDVFSSRFVGRGGTPIPGGFPLDDSCQDYDYAETALKAAAAGNESLQRSWVVVGSPSERRSASTSPVRKKHRVSTNNNPSPTRPVARPSYNARAYKATAASYASPRASPRSGSVPYALSTATSPDQLRQRRPSYASPRSQSSTHRIASEYSLPKTLSPRPSPDVALLEKKLRTQGRRQSDSIKRLNERMQILLREGQQALATKIEVSDPIDDDHDDGGGGGGGDDGDDDDEGYAEGGAASSNDGHDDWLEPAVTVTRPPPTRHTYAW